MTIMGEECDVTLGQVTMFPTIGKERYLALQWGASSLLDER
jgi:hypothetical protein